MSDDAQEPPIFTPDTEPYLGLQAVLEFDQGLVALMQEQHRIGPWTRTNPLTPLQHAGSEIVPGACSIAFSIRELVRQGYLLGARILLRPLLERVITLTYLQNHPDKVALWAAGWPHGSRPSIQQRVQSLRGPGNSSPKEVMDEFSTLLDEFNSLVHGDPRGALSGAVLSDDGAPVFTVTKDLRSPARAAETCKVAALMCTALTARCKQVFPWRVS